MKNIPKAKNTDLVVQDIKKETLIYDLLTNKTYCLNETSSIIWKHCDGKRTVAKISRDIDKDLRIAICEDLIWLALDQFNKDGLLETSSEFVSHFEGLSRRSVIRKIGFTSVVALPIVSYLTAPEPTMAQSLLANNSTCTADPQCASGNCLTTPLFGVSCCAAGVGLGTSPGINAGCVIDQAECNARALTNCCSGTATLGASGAPSCPISGFACVCN